MKRLLILLIIPLIMVGCGCPAFVAAGEKYHDSSSKLIKDYIIDGKPVPNSLDKDEIQKAQDKFKAAIEAEKK